MGAIGDLAAANLAIAELYATVGAQVRNVRLGRNITQDQLAAAVGLTRTSVTNLETGRQRPPLHVLVAIAQALDVDPEALLSGYLLPTLVEVMPPSSVQLRRALEDAQEKIKVALAQLPEES